MKVWAAIHQGPSASGRERHFAPLSWRQMIAPIVRRRCRGGTLAAGRQASISGASTSHCSSVRPIASSSKPEERPPRPRVQALTGPSGATQKYLCALSPILTYPGACLGMRARCSNPFFTLAPSPASMRPSSAAAPSSAAVPPSIRQERQESDRQRPGASVGGGRLPGDFLRAGALARTVHRRLRLIRFLSCPLARQLQRLFIKPALLTPATDGRATRIVALDQECSIRQDFHRPVLDDGTQDPSSSQNALPAGPALIRMLAAAAP